MPLTAPPPTRTATRGRGPYDRRGGGGSQGGKSRDRGAKGPPKLPPGANGRDLWRPPSPITDPPLPPAPLLPPWQTGGLALGALLSELWNMWNSRAKEPPLNPDWEKTFTGSGTLTVQMGRIANMKALYRCSNDTLAQGANTINRPATLFTVSSTGYKVTGPRKTKVARTCAVSSSVAQYLRVYSRNTNGTYNEVDAEDLPSGTSGGGTYYANEPDEYEALLTITYNGVPQTQPEPQPRFPYLPELMPLPEPLPDLAPMAPPGPATQPPLAPPVPDQPPEQPDPLAPPAPQSPPAPAPFTPLTPWAPPLPIPQPTQPLPVPNPQPTNPDGNMAPQPVPPPVTTPPGEEDFLGQPIGQPGTAPPPTLEGIAQEVGKIEQKLRIIGSQPPAGGGDLGALLDLIQLILTLLQSAYGPGSYEIEGPCEPQFPGGGPQVREASWGGGVGGFAMLRARMDALAELLQHHKDLRQPVCATKASGEEVTVIFEEI
jgi:hypothetical protein